MGVVDHHLMGLTVWFSLEFLEQSCYELSVWLMMVWVYCLTSSPSAVVLSVIPAPYDMDQDSRLVALAPSEIL